jgi:prepilin-type N-terminal cleavage/methylation domain-containing protein
MKNYFSKIKHSCFEYGQSGFTLIELLIVTSLMVFLVLTVTAMFMTFLISNAKTNTRNTLKVAGTQALSQIEFLLRNSFQLVPNANSQVCQSVMNNIRFESIDGGTTTISLDAATNKIASNSAFLTSDAVRATTLNFDCTETSNGTQYVTIYFELEKVSPAINNSGGTATREEFSTTVNLRN